MCKALYALWNCFLQSKLIIYACREVKTKVNKTQNNNIECGRCWQIEFDVFFYTYYVHIPVLSEFSTIHIYIIYPKKPRSWYPQNHSIASVIQGLIWNWIVECLNFFFHRLRKLRTRAVEEAYTRSYAWKIMKPVEKSIFIRL